MGWMEFVAALVASLAWPLVAVAVLVAFRKQLITLANRSVRRIKAGPLEAEWFDTLQEVKTVLEVEAIAEEVGSAGSDGRGRFIERIRQLVDEEPDVAVVAAFHLVEVELVRVAEIFGIEVGKSPSRLTAQLMDRGLISGVIARAIDRLRRLRNAAAHPSASGGSVDREEAIGYVDIVEDLLDVFDREWEIRNSFVAPLSEIARMRRSDLTSPERPLKAASPDGGRPVSG